LKPKQITFATPKKNHFYAIQNKKGEFELITNPKKGDKVYEYAVISGGSDVQNPLLLQIPIPSCEKHQHKGKPFIVNTCRNWKYIAIPTPLGSLRCRECNDELFLPEPYLRFADLSSADLSSADLRFADLSSADLTSADLRSADLTSADLRSADLRSADLTSANLRSADLRSADLTSADLTSANLTSADLTSADLTSADLSSADLTSANLRSADLTSADLSHTWYSNRTLETIDDLWKDQLVKQGRKI